MIFEHSELLKQAVVDKLVSVQKHPNADLYIYNYSPRCQFERIWTPATMAARGLILDGEMNVIARPFPKFFNLSEHQPEEIPNLPFEVYDKLDGSLGLLYFLHGVPYIATRGSFTSEQAVHASKLLHCKYQSSFHLFDFDRTYLFEIIYPENKIVCDYQGCDDLFLLSVRHTDSGEELPYRYLQLFSNMLDCPVVDRFGGFNDLEELKKIQWSEKEGFVVRFSNGFRVKVKFEEYIRLHRIVTGVSTVTIWEHLSQGRSIEELLTRVPDEFYIWVDGVRKDLCNQFYEIEEQCRKVFKVLETRKETALYFQQQKYPSVLFRMLDKSSYDELIWKMIRPKFCKAFRVEP